MKTSKRGLHPELAWALCQGLTKLSLLLWDCYGKEFLKLEEEEKSRRGSVAEEDRESETPLQRLYK